MVVEIKFWFYMHCIEAGNPLDVLLLWSFPVRMEECQGYYSLRRPEEVTWKEYTEKEEKVEEWREMS